MRLVYRHAVALSAKPVGIAEESFARRVAKLRSELGWTQAHLAERLGMSRVALSHVEASLSVPSERTVTLLAGVFGCEPHTLVAGTDYPAAKAQRLPVVVARHTEVDHQLAVLAAVLGVAERAPEPVRGRLLAELRAEWSRRLAALLEHTEDEGERRRVRSMLGDLAGRA